MKTKILLAGVVLLLVAGIAAAVMWWPRRPQVIILDNGDKLTLVGVTYGKHHALPTGKKTLAASQRRRRGGQVFDTPNNTLVVWIRQEHPANHWQNYQTYLYDPAGTACVGQSSRRSWGAGTNEVVCVQFDSFPHRPGKIHLKVQEYVPNVGQVMNGKYFIFANPARGPFDRWLPEPLPATKTDEDFTVTLTKLETGVAGGYNRDPDHPDDVINKGVEAVFQAQQNGTNTVNWLPVGIETSDATGNHQGAGASSHWDGDTVVSDYQWGLWAGEPAWKLRVEFSQQSNFSDRELWSVTNIPVQAGTMQNYWNWTRSRTNTPFAQTTINGAMIKIYPVQQFTDMSPGSSPEGVLFMHADGMPEGMHLTLLKLTDAQGGDIQNWGWSTDSYGLRDISGVTNFNLTIAVHQSHFFEFTVKPARTTEAAP